MISVFLLNLNLCFNPASVKSLIMFDRVKFIVLLNCLVCKIKTWFYNNYYYGFFPFYYPESFFRGDGANRSVWAASLVIHLVFWYSQPESVKVGSAVLLTRSAAFTTPDRSLWSCSVQLLYQTMQLYVWKLCWDFVIWWECL